MVESLRLSVAVTGTIILLLSTTDNKAKYKYLATDELRIPQNLMTAGPVLTSLDRTLYYAVKSQDSALDDYLEEILGTISNNTCIKFKRVEIHRLLKSSQVNDLAYLIEDYICYLTRADFSDTEENGAQRIIRRLFGCLGKLYEHQRMDRDLYIDIHWENMDSSNSSKLTTVKDSTTLGLPYDFSSIMQLRYDVYSNNNLPTILPKNGSIPMEMSGGATWPSKQDYLDLNLFYCGTGMVVKSFKVTEIGTDFLTIQWKVKQNYTGFFWEVSSKCRLDCSPIFYTEERKEFPRSQNEMTLFNLKPNSKCTINLRARFTPAKFDLGLDLASHTLALRPTRAPADIKVISVTKREAILSWEKIPCCQLKGKILYYVARYDHMVPFGKLLEEESQVDNYHWGITLSQLHPNTDYSVRVAGATSAGVGVFSLPIALITLGDPPGPVEMTSSDSNCSSVTITWRPPLDENGLPHIVRLRYSYYLRKKVVVNEIVSCTSWTVSNLESGSPVLVHFTLKAANRRGLTGPCTTAIVRTRQMAYNRKRTVRERS